MQKYSFIVISMVSIIGIIFALLSISASERIVQFFEPVLPERKIEYVQPAYVNGSSIVTLSKDQGLDGVVVNRVFEDSVEVDYHSGTFGSDNVETIILEIGDSHSGICAAEAILLSITPNNAATFNVTAGGYCPICYHVYNPQLYLTDDSLQAFTTR